MARRRKGRDSPVSTTCVDCSSSISHTHSCHATGASIHPPSLARSPSSGSPSSRSPPGPSSDASHDNHTHAQQTISTIPTTRTREKDQCAGCGAWPTATSAMTRLLLLLLLWASLASFPFLSVPSPSSLLLPCHAFCTPPPPLPPVVQVALLVFCKGPVGILSDNPTRAPECQPDDTPRHRITIRPFLEGLDMYVSAMNEQGEMPLSDGGSVRWNYTYINVGAMDWLATDWAPIVDVVGTGGLAEPYQEGKGLAWELASPALSPRWGGPYTFVIPQMYMRDSESREFILACQIHQSCLVVLPFTSSAAMARCLEPLPADCVGSGIRDGGRRFSHALGVLWDSSYDAVSAFESFHTLGVRSLVIVGEHGGSQGAYQFSRYPSDVMRVSQEVARQLNLHVLQSVELDGCTNDTATGRHNCPTDSAGNMVPGQVQTYPDGHTALSLARNISALNPDALQFIVSTGGQAQHAFASLLNAMRAIDWTPRMISWHGGGDAALRPFLDNYDDLLHTWATQPWAEQLTGPNYHNVKTGSNFELFPASGELDAPAVFSRAFNARYSSTYHGGSGFNFRAVGAVVPVLGYHALTIAQKLIEAALTADVATLVTTAPKLSVPSAYGLLQFDTTGRTQRINQVLLQYVPTTPAPASASAPGATGTGTATAAKAFPASSYYSTTSSPPDTSVEPHSVQLIAPYGIGVTPVFPLPTWGERLFRPRWYADPLEKMMAGINTVCILFCVGVLAVVARHRGHPVIRAATPPLCVLTILGAVVMLCSTYFRTMHHSDFTCAASPWFLTTGFTLLFGSLFLKTYRIWRILFSQLTQVRMQDRDMLLAVGAFLLVDVALNTAWQVVAGMHAVEVEVDPLRPAYNFTRCTSSPAYRAFIYVHVVLKCGLLLCAIMLTWAVRRSPSHFNESALLSLCWYNVSLVLIFVIPMIGAGLGGRRVTMLLRGFAIAFVGVATVAILFIPKIAQIYWSHKVPRRNPPLSAVCQSGMSHVHSGQQAGGFVSPGSAHSSREHVRSRLTRSSQHRHTAPHQLQPQQQPYQYGSNGSSRQSSPARRHSMRDGSGGTLEMQVLQIPPQSQQSRRKSLTTASSAATIASTTTNPATVSNASPPSMMTTLATTLPPALMAPYNFVPTFLTQVQASQMQQLQQAVRFHNAIADLPPPALDGPHPPRSSAAAALSVSVGATTSSPAASPSCQPSPSSSISDNGAVSPLQPSAVSVGLHADAAQPQHPQQQQAQPVLPSPPHSDRTAADDGAVSVSARRLRSSPSAVGRLSISPVAEVPCGAEPLEVPSPIPGAVDNASQHGQYPEDDRRSRGE